MSYEQEDRDRQRRYGFTGQQYPDQFYEQEDQERQRRYGFTGQQEPNKSYEQRERDRQRKYGFAGQEESVEQIRKKHGFMGTDDKNFVETLFGMK